MKIKTKNGTVDRGKIGKLSGIVGIICNLLLSAGKITVGAAFGSMSVLADGLNNLSDSASSVITFLGFKLAEKPADKKHPFGHARFEYLAGLTVSMLILVIGFELVKTSVKKIIAPSPIELSPLMLCVLILSIVIKLFMMLFYRHMGKKINSSALATTAADSRNDVITTSAVLVAAVLEHFTDCRIDGIASFLVSVFILYNGISLAKKTASPLLGEGADPQLQKDITDYISSCPMVIGCHDLMVHDYGPGKRYATIHVEMDKDVDAFVCHRMIDNMERECISKFETHLVIHYDPVLTNDPETERLKRMVTTILKMRDERLDIHDFRVISQDNITELTFDMVVPTELRNKEEEIKTSLEQALSHIDKKQYTTHITFDI